jgi:molybdate transport system regulatory protein
MSEPRTSRNARLRVVLATGIGIGPGKAELLEGIRATGSIAAAGQSIGMSYIRAWLLASALNQHFAHPLIETSMGGKAGGGAHLTPLGAKVLDAYRDTEQRTEKAIAPIASRLNRLRTPDKRCNKG